MLGWCCFDYRRKGALLNRWGWGLRQTVAESKKNENIKRWEKQSSDKTQIPWPCTYMQKCVRLCVCRCAFVFFFYKIYEYILTIYTHFLVLCISQICTPLYVSVCECNYKQKWAYTHIHMPADKIESNKVMLFYWPSKKDLP